MKERKKMAEVSVSPEDVLRKFSNLYPVEFKHVLAEVRAEFLEAQVDAMNAAAEAEVETSD